jgi:hypothetical protein
MKKIKMNLPGRTKSRDAVIRYQETVKKENSTGNAKPPKTPTIT